MDEKIEEKIEEKMDRKDYLQDYYHVNKEKIAAKLYKKEVCECCSRIVTHQNMSKHKTLAVCKRQGRIRKELSLLQRMKETIKCSDDETVIINNMIEKLDNKKK